TSKRRPTRTPWPMPRNPPQKPPRRSPQRATRQATPKTDRSVTRVVLGVSGGIAAYKAAEILRLFTENGNQVRVIPTPSSLAFVGTATWEALSGQAATTDVFENVDLVGHVRHG